MHAIFGAHFLDIFFVRRLICLFILMIMPLQALALQGGWSPNGNMFDLVHDIEHRQGTSHHHEDDDTLHYDDSTKSAKHSADHECCQQTATLLSDFLLLLTFPPTSIAIHYLGIDVPDGFHERPQRPPSALG